MSSWRLCARHWKASVGRSGPMLVGGQRAETAAVRCRHAPLETCGTPIASPPRARAFAFGRHDGRRTDPPSARDHPRGVWLCPAHVRRRDRRCIPCVRVRRHRSPESIHAFLCISQRKAFIDSLPGLSEEDLVRLNQQGVRSCGPDEACSSR